MAKTKFVLEGDEAKAVAAFLKVVDAQDKTTGGMRKMARQAKATKGEMSAFKNIAADIGKLAAGFFTAQGAISGVRTIMRLLIDEFDDLKRKQEAASQATITHAKDFIGIIGTWLGVSQIDRAHEALRSLAADLPQLSPEMGRAMLGAYGGARPAAPLERGIEAVRMAVPLTWEDRPGVLRLVGQLERIMPGKTMEDLFDVAIGLRRQAGKHIEELETGMVGVHKLLASAIPPEQVMGTLMAAFAGEQRGRAVGTITSLLSMPRLPVKRPRGRRMTEEEQIKSEIAGMTDVQLFNWMQDEPEKAKKIFKTTWATVAPIMRPGAIAAGTQMVREAQAEDTYRRSVQEAGRQRLVRKVALEEEHKAAVEWQKMAYGKGDIAGTARRWITERLEGMPGIGATERKMILAATEIQGLWGGDYVAAAVRNLGVLRGGFERQTIPRGPYPGYMGIPYMREARPSPIYNPEMAEAISSLMDQLGRLLQTSETQPERTKELQVLEEMRDLMKDSTISPNINAGVLD